MDLGVNSNTDIYSRVRDKLLLPEIDITTYSPLTMAFIGDAIYEIAIRTYVVSSGNTSVSKLHTKSSEFVNAQAQCRMYQEIEPILTEEELAAYKRGRNSKPHTKAKNATFVDYKKATGFEALMGYLYLTGRSERMLELIKYGLDRLNRD